VKPSAVILAGLCESQGTRGDARGRAGCGRAYQRATDAAGEDSLAGEHPRLKQKKQRRYKGDILTSTPSRTNEMLCYNAVFFATAGAASARNASWL